MGDTFGPGDVVDLLSFAGFNLLQPIMNAGHGFDQRHTGLGMFPGAPR